MQGQERQDLKRSVMSFADQWVENRQVEKRLKELQTQYLYQLVKIETQKQPQLNQSRLLRHALVHENYRKYIERLIDVRYQAAWQRVQYETHLMLYQARQSIQSFYKNHNKGGRSC